MINKKTESENEQKAWNISLIDRFNFARLNHKKIDLKNIVTIIEIK